MRTRTKTRPDTDLAYVERVNLAIDYVVGHLAGPLRLKDVSRAAMMSPFHFHRVFQGLMGVTLADFVKRLRLERAVVMMAHGGRRPSLTSISLGCGFSSSSDFSRCFKQRFGVAPSTFNMKSWRASHGSALQAMVTVTAESLHLGGLPEGQNPDGFRVKIRDLPARTVAYIRVLNPYKGGGVVGAVQRLVAWADRNGFADGQWLGYQWDNPEVTSLEDCQYHVAVEVPAERFTPKGEIGKFRFPAMVVAQVEIRGGIDLELRGLQWLYRTWLPRSGYVPDDQPGFEAWIGRPFAHGMEHFELYAQIPVKRG